MQELTLLSIPDSLAFQRLCQSSEVALERTGRLSLGVEPPNQAFVICVQTEMPSSVLVAGGRSMPLRALVRVGEK